MKQPVTAALTATVPLALACASDPPPAPAAPIAPASTAIDTTPIADPVANVPPSCKQGTKPAASGLIDDLEDGNVQVAALGGRDGSWWVSKDEHATIAIPAGGAKAAEGGATGSKFGMHFVGKTDNADDWGAAVGVNFLAG